jgi:hypothetical protein
VGRTETVVPAHIVGQNEFHTKATLKKFDCKPSPALGLYQAMNSAFVAYTESRQRQDTN